MQQGLQERVRNCERIRTDQGSIYLKKLQGQQLAQRLKRVETWLLQLGHLARLVHYMVCQNVVSLIEEKITAFVANILKVRRRLAACVEGAGRRGPAGGKRILTSSPVTSPDPSLQAPRQNPLLLAQLVFDSSGQLSHEPSMDNIIQIITGGLQFVKTSALKVCWLCRGPAVGIPRFLSSVIGSFQPAPNPHCFPFLPLHRMATCR